MRQYLSVLAGFEGMSQDPQHPGVYPRLSDAIGFEEMGPPPAAPVQPRKWLCCTFFLTQSFVDISIVFDM